MIELNNACIDRQTQGHQPERHLCTLHARCREVNDSRLAITSGEGPLFILGRRYVLEWSVYPG